MIEQTSAAGRGILPSLRSLGVDPDAAAEASRTIRAYQERLRADGLTMQDVVQANFLTTHVLTTIDELKTQDLGAIRKALVEKKIVPEGIDQERFLSSLARAREVFVREERIAVEMGGRDKLQQSFQLENQLGQIWSRDDMKTLLQLEAPEARVLTVDEANQQFRRYTENLPSSEVDRLKGVVSGWKSKNEVTGKANGFQIATALWMDESGRTTGFEKLLANDLINAAAAEWKRRKEGNS